MKPVIVFIKKLLRLFHTVKYFSISQISYRLYYRWHRLGEIPLLTVSQTRDWTNAWLSPEWQNTKFYGDCGFNFLNEIGYVHSKSDWNNVKKNKLWLYNLHYLDELNTINSDTRKDKVNRLIRRWIVDNPAPCGNGWEPYPLSLRLINLVKWHMRQDFKCPEILYSIQQQTVALSKQLEFHILGNHLFTNAKALVFAGAAMNDGESYLLQGLKILDTEIPKQFFEDGGHFELSPMYHACLMWDMCDLLNLANMSGIESLQLRKSNWSGVIKRGLLWLNQMCHPDGGVAFFNDSVFDISPSYADLCNYAAKLDVFEVKPSILPISIAHLKESGYIAIQSEPGIKLIVDVGEVGPSYQPGHAHADTLSFELSLFSHRIFVNTGISEYGTGSIRKYQRSTLAHNTVTINGKNSSDVWGGFRVGRRASPKQLELVHSNGKQVTISCMHDGYCTLFRSNYHSRKWVLAQQSCQITDFVTNSFNNAIASYHLHPDILIEQLTADHFQLTLPTGEFVSVKFKNHEVVYIEERQWNPSFGLSIVNNCLVAKLTTDPLKIDITWKL